MAFMQTYIIPNLAKIKNGFLVYAKKSFFLFAINFVINMQNSAICKNAMLANKAKIGLSCHLVFVVQNHKGLRCGVVLRLKYKIDFAKCI